jgi:hypothetical protein
MLNNFGECGDCIKAREQRGDARQLAQKILEIAKLGLEDLEGHGGASGAGFQQYREIITLCQEEVNKQ